MKNIAIVVSRHLKESREFCEWLNKAGYNAIIGNSGSTYVRGLPLETTEDLSSFIKTMWIAYKLDTSKDDEK